jgi:hypothetical protein
MSISQHRGLGRINAREGRKEPTMGIKQTVAAERSRGRRIMDAAMAAGLPSTGLHFIETGLSARVFERVCASLRGEPGTFGHMAGIASPAAQKAGRA